MKQNYPFLYTKTIKGMYFANIMMEKTEIKET